MTITIPVPLPTLTRMGEVRPSDVSYVEPVPATAHLANQTVSAS